MTARDRKAVRHLGDLRVGVGEERSIVAAAAASRWTIGGYVADIQIQPTTEHSACGRGLAAPDAVPPQVDGVMVLRGFRRRLLCRDCAAADAVAGAGEGLRLFLFGVLPLVILKCFSALRFDFVSK